MINRFPTVVRATINDVAAAAGVSKGTVSKYLSAVDYYVADDTRRRIEEAIRALDYQPNAIAQSLTSKRTYTVGVIVASVVNPFYPELIAGVEEVIEPAGYTLLLGSSDDDPAKEAKIVRSMVQRRVDGVIVAAATMRDRAVERLHAAGVLVVLASRETARPIVDSVVIDNRLGAGMAVGHLVGHGHSIIAHFAGPQNVLPFQHRLDGYHKILAGAGLSSSAEYVTEVPFGADGVAPILRAMLDSAAAPTAIFAGNDAIAIQVLEAAEQLGVRVPDDMALVGFDNIWVGRVPGVSLTSVDSKARHVGRAAAHLLAQRLSGKPAHGTSGDSRIEQVVIQPELVVRGSCGCPGAPSP